MKVVSFLPLALAGCLPAPPPWEQDSTSAGELEILPSSIRFDLTVVGCEDRVPVSARNGTADDVEISAATLGDAAEGLDLELDDDGGADPLPWTIAAGDERVLGEVIFAPLGAPAESHLGDLEVSSTALPGGHTKLAISGSVAGSGPEEETFVAGVRPLDLLVTADRSGSTMDELALFVAHFGEVLWTWEQAGVDYRVLAVTRESGCSLLERDPPWIDTRTAATDVSDLLGSMLGATITDEDNPTSGLERAVTALRPENLTTGGCNEGFLRTDSMLHVLGISDGPDESPGDPADYVQTLVALRAAPLATVFDAIGGGDEGCGGYAPYSGFLGAVATTDGQLVDLCEDAWETSLGTTLAEGMARRADATTFILAKAPLKDSIQVSLDQVAVDRAGWSWNPDLNAVVLGAWPAFGAHVIITYYPAPESCD